jgi:GntR family transcriptional regulator/MocR family aminotransferase
MTGEVRTHDGALLGAELEVALTPPPPAARRTRRELYEQLRDAIRAGRLAPGLRMPATRQLAQRLQVSRNTVTSVYELLVGEGLLFTRPGSGAFVAPAVPALEARPRPATDMSRRIRPFWREAWAPTVFPRDAAYPFVLGAPDLARFPFDLWRKIASRATRSHGRSPGRQGAEGDLGLREGIAGHLSFARGIACRAEDIVVTCGAQQAFDLLAKVLVHRPGMVVAVEDPGYPPARLAFAAAGAEVVGVPVDDEGLMVDALPADAEVVYVTPSHQFPLGVPLSPPRRQALLAFARRSGAVVIEDDYDGEFRFDGRPLEALQTLDGSGQVVYVGTFAKSLFPELRLGYVVTPEWLRGPLRAAKQLGGLSPLIAQQTLSDFIAEGHLARHVRRMRRLYAERRAVLLEAMGQDANRWLEPLPSAAGLHLALRLPEALDAHRLLAAAAELGVGAYAAAQFAVGERRCNAVILGYGALAAEPVSRGATALLRAAEGVMAGRA